MKFATTLVLAVFVTLIWNGQISEPAFKEAPLSPFAVDTGPSDVVLGDVNGDGKVDIVTANAKGSSVSVLFADGKGGFQPTPGSRLNVSMPMHLVATGDLNRDEKLDLALTSHDSPAVTVLTGDGTGRFSPLPGSPFAALAKPRAHNHGLALGDVSRDGRLDIVTCDQDDNSVSVLLNRPPAGFTPAPGSPFAVGIGPYPVALADVSGDGVQDIITPNTGSHDLTILLGNGKGEFGKCPGSPVAVKNRPYYVTAGDVNGDARLDLVAAHDDSDLISILLNEGGAKFKSSSMQIGRRAGSIAIADLNRDRRADLGAATNDSITVLLGNGRGGFAPAPGSPFRTGGGSWKVVLGT